MITQDCQKWPGLYNEPVSFYRNKVTFSKQKPKKGRPESVFLVKSVGLGRQDIDDRVLCLLLKWQSSPPGLISVSVSVALSVCHEPPHLQCVSRGEQA